MISIKRTFATLLLFAFCIVFTPQIANSIPLTTNEDSLHDFLQNTKEIKAVFDYPSMEKATNVAGKTKLAAHTPIEIRCTETISTKDIVDVALEVLMEVNAMACLVYYTQHTDCYNFDGVRRFINR